MLGWSSVYAYNAETFGPNGTMGRISERDVLVRDLRAALERLNPDLLASVREQAIEKLTRIAFARSLLQHNRRALRAQFNTETKWHAEDQRNLHRLVKIRFFLWT